MRRGTCLLLALLLFLCCCNTSLFADVDRITRERMLSILGIVSDDIRKNFYDTDLKKLDWKGLTDQARTKINSAKTVSEMVTAIYVLVDKLDDSHTRFLPPGRGARPVFGFSAKAYGENILVYAVAAQSAAAKAGMQVGDRILTVNRFRAERSTWNLMMYDFRLLHPSTEMVITFRHGDQPPRTETLKAAYRKDVAVLDVYTLIWRLWNEFEQVSFSCKLFDNKVGYLQVTTFDMNQMPQSQKFNETPRAVVLDMRGNHGGFEDTLLEFAGHFEPEPTTMGNVVGRKKTEVLKVHPHKPSFAQVPVVVLVDSESASAAEMMARHLQLSRKAVVIGDRTSGRVNSSRYFSEALSDTKITGIVVPFGVQISVRKVVMADGQELEHRG